MSTIHNLWRDIELIRTQSPLIINITNFVVMNNTANALLALGASPAMSHTKEEVAEITSYSKALVINIGTLSPDWVEGMCRAIISARDNKIPIILDPVAIGATQYRRDVISSLISLVTPNIIRGNASEILSLEKMSSEGKGADSVSDMSHAKESAIRLAQRLDTTVIVSGSDDFITDGAQEYINSYGTPLMTKVTGMGCTATALCGAFAGVNNNYFETSIHAMLTMGICGELALEKTKLPGSFQTEFINALYSLSFETLKKYEGKV